MYSKLRLLCICFLFCQLSYAADTTKLTEGELHLLIDVSGSMKHTDPGNLRIPAVKLMINLLPAGMKAGIWIFAQDTRVLIKKGIVNQQWKRMAIAGINKIHSSGLYTHIEDAINTSAEAWFNTPVKGKRYLVLLTDGMVDVSKDIMASAESRDKVMMEQIPRLQQAGVKVFTIALSENADAELMEKLALDTNGWAEIASSSTQLQKIFFKIFKKAVPQETVPLIGKSFVIDPSIKEFSILVFKKLTGSSIKMQTPDHQILSKSTNNKDVMWLNDKNYDLITIKKPKPGTWLLDAQADPDNQVMIVTDLKFNIDEIPNYIGLNDSLEITAYFTDQQQLISRQDFLSLIEISIESIDPLKGKKVWKMHPVADKPGLFSKTISKLSKGVHTFKIIAKSKTFQRESQMTVKVIDSPIEVKTYMNSGKRTVTLTLIPDTMILDTSMMTVQASISESGQTAKTLELEKKAGRWMIEVAVPEPGIRKQVNFSVIANTLKGESVSPIIKPVVIDNDLLEKIAEKQKKEQLETIKRMSSDSVEETKKPEQQQTQQDVEVEQGNDESEVGSKQQPVNWLITILIIAGLNIVVFGGGFFVYKMIKKKSAEKQAELLDRLA